MRIGILTIHDSPNYGACLQCYALWKYLTDQGYDCEVIDLHRPGSHEDYVPSKRFTRCRPIPTSAFAKLKKSLKTLLGLNQKPKSLYGKEAKSKFDAFNSLYKKSSPFLGPDALYNDPPKYDVYITGSDQLWNPMQPYSLDPFFLTFVHEKSKKKISFATSVGITELREEEKVKFNKWLSDYSAISVREKQAKILLESFIDKPIVQIADPSFLIDKMSWSSVSFFSKIKTPYILYFALRIDNNVLDYCKRLSKECNSYLYVLNQTQVPPIDNSYIAITDAGPSEFLGYIANAELVITDSFHGTVFSILMEAKNFYTYIGNGNKRGSRIEDLLDMFSLTDHIFRDDISASYKDLQDNRPDSLYNRSIVSAEKTKAVEFLKKSIEQ